MVMTAYPGRIVLRMKHNQTCFAVVLTCLMDLFHKTVYAIVRKVSRGVSTKVHSIDFGSPWDFIWVLIFTPIRSSIPVNCNPENPLPTPTRAGGSRKSPKYQASSFNRGRRKRTKRRCRGEEGGRGKGAFLFFFLPFIFLPPPPPPPTSPARKPDSQGRVVLTCSEQGSSNPGLASILNSVL